MITIETLTEFLGWSLVINVAILTLSTLGVIAMRRTIVGIHSKLFSLEESDTVKAHFQYLAQYKIAIIVLNFSPYLALKIMA